MGRLASGGGKLKGGRPPPSRRGSGSYSSTRSSRLRIGDGEGESEADGRARRVRGGERGGGRGRRRGGLVWPLRMEAGELVGGWMDG